MKNRCFLIAAFLITAIFGGQSADAQITINIPKIPKIKKPKIEQTQESETTVTTTGNSQTTVTKNTSPDKKPNDEMDFRLKMFLDDIAKARKEVDEYNANDKLYLVNSTSTEWLWRAVSPKERGEWTEKWKTLLTSTSRKMFDDALDELNAAAAKKLPAYQGYLKNYTIHNAADERMIKGTLKNIAEYKIFSSGLQEGTWLIDKNDYGLPTARYKHGVIYLRRTTSDHPYCYASYVNVKQDYAGGGTYGASYARFIEDEMVGCPAGAK